MQKDKEDDQTVRTYISCVILCCDCRAGCGRSGGGCDRGGGWWYWWQ